MALLQLPLLWRRGEQSFQQFISASIPCTGVLTAKHQCGMVSIGTRGKEGVRRQPGLLWDLFSVLQKCTETHSNLSYTYMLLYDYTNSLSKCCKTSLLPHISVQTDPNGLGVNTEMEKWLVKSSWRSKMFLGNRLESVSKTTENTKVEF